MLRHVVLLKFRENYSLEVLKDITEQLDSMMDKVPNILSFTHGPDAGATPVAFDYGVVADFASKEDLLAYLGHPAHKAMGGNVMKIVAEAVPIQFYC